MPRRWSASGGGERGRPHGGTTAVRRPKSSPRRARRRWRRTRKYRLAETQQLRPGSFTIKAPVFSLA